MRVVSREQGLSGPASGRRKAGAFGKSRQRNAVEASPRRGSRAGFVKPRGSPRLPQEVTIAKRYEGLLHSYHNQSYASNAVIVAGGDFCIRNFGGEETNGQRGRAQCARHNIQRRGAAGCDEKMHARRHRPSQAGMRVSERHDEDTARVRPINQMRRGANNIERIR